MGKKLEQLKARDKALREQIRELEKAERKKAREKKKQEEAKEKKRKAREETTKTKKVNKIKYLLGAYQFYQLEAGRADMQHWLATMDKFLTRQDQRKQFFGHLAALGMISREQAEGYAPALQKKPKQPEEKASTESVEETEQIPTTDSSTPPPLPQ